MSKNSIKIPFPSISLFFHLMAIGMQSQTIIHWFLFILVMANRTYYIYVQKEYLSNNFGMATFLLEPVNQLLLYVFLLWKRKSIATFIRQSKSKLSTNYLFIIRMVDLAFLIFTTSILIEDASYYWILGYDTCSDTFKSIVSDEIASHVIGKVVCFNAIINNLIIDISCCFYLIFFLALHYIKGQYIQCIRTSGSFELKERVIIFSSEVLQLQGHFESSFSFILFFKVVNDFLIVMIQLLTTLVITQIDPNALDEVQKVYRVTESLRYLVFSCFMFLVISVAQEKMEEKCDLLRHQIICMSLVNGSSGEVEILGKMIMRTFTKKVSIWNIIEVSRSILVKLASAYLVFPVLLAQVNNGGLGKLKFSGLNQTNILDILDI